jgi:hypothetical protein
MKIKLKKNQFHLIGMELYPITIAVSYDQTYQQLAKHTTEELAFFQNVEKRLNDDFWDDGTSTGSAFNLGQGLFVIRMHETNNLVKLMDTLSHEIFHITMNIMEYIGDKYEYGSNDEAYAYLNGWITKRVLQNLLNE